ncbi:hypothetical protein MtrunA17_Chr8g0337811 [Medicago truncatula]|uniref:Transmembrane protein n=1 Tax=Medicago truncatula TaxID=3880 RepID=I3T1L5_MEDTR|nr:unknown [Medicago truncatula]RHN38872.1 hypothetical protein MtrunA17_Chr8g0337811 [Medicago truncatula]
MNNIIYLSRVLIVLFQTNNNSILVFCLFLSFFVVLVRKSGTLLKSYLVHYFPCCYHMLFFIFS